MAKGSSPTSDSKLNNSIIKDIIKKLNENPETSLEEFKDIQANTTLNVLWLENLVDSPRNFTSSKNLKASETTESTGTITETTTRSNTKQKIRKRRRKLKKRKRKGKPAQTKLEMATSTEMFLPKISYLNNSSTNAESENLSNIHSKESFSSTNFWAENLVAPIPITSGVPTSFTNTAKLPSGTGNKTINVKYGRNVGRCRKNRGGCAHICNPKGPNRCSCLEGFFLARDRKSCYGKLTPISFRYFLDSFLQWIFFFGHEERD
nr:uncharacterized protein LOC111513281 [Leptinotarsa decemlineata]